MRLLRLYEDDEDCVSFDKILCLDRHRSTEDIIIRRVGDSRAVACCSLWKAVVT